MFTIRKIFKVEAAHQLEEGRCFSKACSDSIHGHSYVIEVFLSAEKLDANGMVIDFGQLKELIGKYIDSWDHAIILSDKTAKSYGKDFLAKNKKVKIVPYNPTAEEMAQNMHGYICEDLCWPPDYVKVRVHETATGWAEYTEDLGEIRSKTE